MVTNLDNIFGKLFKNSAISTYWKDKNGRYAEISEGFLPEFDMLYTAKDILGQRDVDLWGDVPPFHVNDQKVLFNEKKQIFIEDIHFNGYKRFYMSCKSPWYSQSGELLGTAGASILLNPKNSFRLPHNDDNLIQLLDSIQFAYFKNASSTLSKRQMECLSHLAKGMTFKQIASTLKLSPKTVEHYLEIAKIKLNCLNRHELVKKAIELGL